MRPDEIEIEYLGKRYIWTERGGFVDENWLRPPRVIELELQKQLSEILRETDNSITNPIELVKAAAKARDQGHLQRAEKLARRVLDMKPNPAAASVLSACMRDQGRAKEAIEITNPFHSCNNPILLTTRAAAFLDTGQHEPVRPLLDRAYAIARLKAMPTGEISLVYKRLEKLFGE